LIPDLDPQLELGPDLDPDLAPDLDPVLLPDPDLAPDLALDLVTGEVRVAAIFPLARLPNILIKTLITGILLNNEMVVVEVLIYLSLGEIDGNRLERINC
jgi:hypothetical protein